jgi:NitT/TauT family transport system ATP-binding protein
VYPADYVLLLSRPPARVADFRRVALPRPRGDAILADPAFIEQKRRRLEVFQREVRAK